MRSTILLLAFFLNASVVVLDRGEKDKTEVTVETGDNAVRSAPFPFCARRRRVPLSPFTSSTLTIQVNLNKFAWSQPAPQATTG